MKPAFTDRDGYRNWTQQWRIIYKALSSDIRLSKLTLKERQRNGDPSAGKAHRYLHFKSVDATKMLTLLNEARDRWTRIVEMKKQLADQRATFPLAFDTSVADIHFNRLHLEFNDFPMWVIKAKGLTYYIDHLNCQVGWSTRELSEGSTRGMIRVRHCSIVIDSQGVATIVNRKAVSLAA
jgi:hypothetical protein